MSEIESGVKYHPNDLKLEKDFLEQEIMRVKLSITELYTGEPVCNGIVGSDSYSIINETMKATLIRFCEIELKNLGSRIHSDILLISMMRYLGALETLLKNIDAPTISTIESQLFVLPTSRRLYLKMLRFLFSK